MIKHSSILAMCSLIATGVAYSDSSKPYPVVVDRSVNTPDAGSVEPTEETVFVVGNEANVFDMMRQRRAAELAKQPAAQALQAESIAPAAAPVAVEPKAIENAAAVSVVLEPEASELFEQQSIVAEAIEPERTVTAEVPEVIVADDIVGLPTVSEGVSQAAAPAESIETTAAVSSLYQRPDQRSGGASGSDTVEPVALESRNDSARSLTVYASEDAADLKYERDASLINVTNGRIGAGFLFTEERDNIFTANVMLDVQTGLPTSTHLAAGVRTYAALLGEEDQDVGAFALGVEGSHQLQTKILPIELSAAFFYAPDVFTFGDSNRVIDWYVRGGVQLRSNLHAFVGLRFLQFDTQPSDREVDDKLHVGLLWNFSR